LADLTAAYYGNLWFYIETDGHVVCLYGRGDYPTIAEAVAENPPDTLPDRLDATGMLMGRYIFLKSATDPIQVDTAFPPPIGGGTADDHGALTGLGDDDHGQYALLGTTGRTGQVLNLNTGYCAYLYGSQGSGSDLNLYSTSHATKGKINFGSGAPLTAYVEATDHFFIGTIGNSASAFRAVKSDTPFYPFHGESTGVNSNVHFTWKNDAQQWDLILEGSGTDQFKLLDQTNSKTNLVVTPGADAQIDISGTNVTLNSANLAMSGNDITNVDDITGNGGSIFSGGSGSGDDLYLQSTTHATKGGIRLNAAEGVSINSNFTSTLDLLVYAKDASSNTTMRVQSGVANGSAIISIMNDVQDWKIYTHGGFADDFFLYDTTNAKYPFRVNKAGTNNALVIEPTQLSLAVNIDMNGNDIIAVDDITGNGGSIISGGTGSGDDLYLGSTTHATKGNVYIDGETALKGASERCHVYETGGAQSINNNTWTAITLDSERFDPSGLHDPASNPSRITIAKAGIYIVGGNLGWAAHASDQTRRIASISVNGVPGVGTEIARQENHISGITAVTGQAMTVLWSFSANDYVELCGFQNSGGALNTLAPASYSPSLWVQRLV
jgi:hypothetical protein